MRVALVADWLVTFGGAEHVVAELHTLWPDAPLFCTVARILRPHPNPNPNPSSLGPLATANIRTTPLQKWYRLFRHHQLFLPWMPRAVEEIDLRGYDCIISSSHAVAKGIVPPPTALHVCYCHTPMRYAWEMEEEYLDDFHIPRWLQPLVKRQLKRLRRWDLTTGKRVDLFLANSPTTQERIQRTYARESIVIPPPVHDRFFRQKIRPTPYPLLPTPYYLAIGRLVPYKRFDLLIAAANVLQFPLVIAGDGHDRRRLERQAGPTVRFLGRVTDDALPALYTGAEALLFPAFEDAGLVPLEAQACGTPVIAYGKGGVVHIIRDGTTGLLFPAQTVESLRDALARFRTIHWDRAAIRAHAQQFAAKRFRERVRSVVEEAYSSLPLGKKFCYRAPPCDLHASS